MLVATQMLVEPHALAFEETRTEYGVRLRLTSFPVRVRFDAPVPGLSDGGQVALLRAIASWNARACSSPLLVMTDDEDDTLVEIVPVVDHWKFGSAIAAHTAVESEPFGGEVRHVIIEIDARRKWSQEMEVSPDALDLESILLHELGHALGLEHSRQDEAVMRAGIKTGQTRRTLHADDLAGVCAVTSRVVLGKDESLASFGRTFWRAKGVLGVLVLVFLGAGVVAFGLVKRAWS